MKAIDAASRKLVWRFYTGTGNGSPWIFELRSSQGGDNLCLCSILADLEIGGRTRQVLMQAPKNGFFYVLGRRTGELPPADPFSKVTCVSHVDLKTCRPVENPKRTLRNRRSNHYPRPIRRPQLALDVIPSGDGPGPHPRPGSAFSLHPEPGLQVSPGWRNEGVEQHPSGEPFSPTPGYLLAWDPRAREERWRVDHKSNANGGTLATAGDLVFQGNAAGYFAPYRAANGEKLWEVFLGNGIVAAPITY